MTQTAFCFLDAPRLFTLIDHELELVEPSSAWVNDLLAACHHPQTRRDMPAMAKTTRETLQTFLSQNPGGHTAPDGARGIAPGYTFWMRVRRAVPLDIRQPPPPIMMAGSISLRLGHDENLDQYLGHIGYHVLPAARGRNFAQRAAAMLLPLARAHGQDTLWITCNPENAASRRTCEGLGARYVDTLAVPSANALYTQGDRQKCRYRLDL
ncbi:MAG TPA: GNAT family N-acetyltransferase [Phycisphaerae bacterium]|nr:GNAT family N-acetyltransferase [Phycisphaerae bacterium]